jgi:hypothetical protein
VHVAGQLGFAPRPTHCILEEQLREAIAHLAADVAAAHGKVVVLGHSDRLHRSEVELEYSSGNADVLQAGQQARDAAWLAPR